VPAQTSSQNSTASRPGGADRLLVWLAPELGLLATRSEQREVMKRSRSRAMIWRLVWLELALMPILFAAQWFGIKWLIPALQRQGMSFVSALLIEIGLFQILVLAGVLLVFRGCQGQMRAAIRAELVKRGICVCVGCGYDCRGQREARCPECGRTFDAALLRATPPAADGADHA